MLPKPFLEETTDTATWLIAAGLLANEPGVIAARYGALRRPMIGKPGAPHVRDRPARQRARRLFLNVHPRRHFNEIIEGLTTLLARRC